MSQVVSFVRYLAIPSGYPPTDDLHWSKSAEAIEGVDGQSFLLTPTLAPFLEGFAAQRPLIHFCYMLDLLRLLGLGDGGWEGMKRRRCEMIRDAHRAGGRSMRNAGAFFATVARDIVSAWMSGATSLALAKWLATSPVYPTMVGWENPEPPPFDAATFRHLIANAIEEYSEADIYHWLRFGQPPLDQEGLRLAEELVVSKPPSRIGTLEDLLRTRPRLAGALPLVGTMVSALTLPPRRRTPPELPIGGYSDVTTRGDPAHLLPSQFALDPDEFVRRFAEKELLFFRREEPHHRTRDRLILLVDQGVRTWGTIRLALSAAVLAFRKLAARRGLPFLIRFGSNSMERIDPADCDLERLTELLENSDLSAVPVDLLTAENDDDPDEADVVLLTHPRSLAEDDVRYYAGSVPASKRLFALAVDDAGDAQFSAYRGGEPVKISRFRVDFSAQIVQPVGASTDPLEWRGDVEPAPFPFAIGPFHKIVAAGFDADATHFLVATQKGYLHLYPFAAGKPEMLPRASHNGHVMQQVDAIIGVRGGLVVGGIINDILVAAHYDLARRTVKVHSLGPPGVGPMRWHAFPEIQSIAVRQVALCRGLDLNSGAMYAEPEQPPASNARAHRAYLQALIHELPAPFIPIAPRRFGQATPDLPHPFLEHDRETGRVTVFNDAGKKSLLPHADGSLLFTGDIIRIAQTAGNALALRTLRNQSGVNRADWFLFDMDDASSLRELPAAYNDEKLNRLSPDGRYFARYWTNGQFLVYRLGATAPGLTIAPGRIHNHLSVQLGRRCLNIIIGARKHVLSWREGPLTHQYRRIGKDEILEHGVVAERRGTHPFFAYDPARFYAFASKDVDVVLDAAGQVIVFDSQRNRLACIFLVWRDELAAWLPDGTRYGSAIVNGVPARPDALEKIGAALRAADSAV
jgi:hypothetical protein